MTEQTQAVTTANPQTFPEKASACEIILPVGKANFANLWTPKSPQYNKNDEPKPPRFGLTLSIPKEIASQDPTWNYFVGALKHYALQLLAPADLQNKKFSRGFTDGDKTDKPYQQGCFVVRPWANKDHAPIIVDKDGEEIPASQESKLGIGATVKVSVSPYVFEKGAKGIILNLRAVQIFDWGKPFFQRDAGEYKQAFAQAGGIPKYAQELLTKKEAEEDPNADIIDTDPYADQGAM